MAGHPEPGDASYHLCQQALDAYLTEEFWDLEDLPGWSGGFPIASPRSHFTVGRHQVGALGVPTVGKVEKYGGSGPLHLPPRHLCYQNSFE